MSTRGKKSTTKKLSCILLHRQNWVLGWGGKHSFSSTSTGDLKELPRCLWEVRYTEELEGPLGTPLGLTKWKRASSRLEAGTSGFLSISDSDLRVPAGLGQEIQASSCLSNGTLLASCLSPDTQILLCFPSRFQCLLGIGVFQSVSAPRA